MDELPEPYRRQVEKLPNSGLAAIGVLSTAVCEARVIADLLPQNVEPARLILPEEALGYPHMQNRLSEAERRNLHEAIRERQPERFSQL